MLPKLAGILVAVMGMVVPSALRCEETVPHQESEDPAKDNFSLFSGVSTLGPWIQVQYPISDQWGIRFSSHLLYFKANISKSGITSRSDFLFNVHGLIGEWSPKEERYHLAFGAFYNGSHIGLDAEGRVKILNDVVIRGVEADGQIDFQRFAPYLGIGYRGPLDVYENVQIWAEFGYLFYGKPRVELDVQDPSGLVTQTQISEQRKKIRDKFDYKFFPLVSFGIRFRF